MTEPHTPAISHGGNLHEAARRYGIPYEQWLDLSTGINPHGYPVPPVPADAWRRLPDEGDGFAARAAQYYGAPDAAHVLPVAGSQAAIRALPMLLPQATVGIAPLTYSEYAPAFTRAGHRVVPLDVSRAVLPDDLVHVALVNPNNPSADYLDTQTLLHWHEQLSARGGTLLVDEAFADAMPAPGASLAGYTARAGLVVLRSPGKFFGLAGVRSGFVLGTPALLDALRDRLGAWTVSGPARHAVGAAFADTGWQQQTHEQLAVQGARLAGLLRAQRFAVRATPLFVWTSDARAAALHEALAALGIWTRFFAQQPSLRIGLPASEHDWARFEQALQQSVQAIDANHGAR
jgi:cobalamin biosynthetic protein CobC